MKKILTKSTVLVVAIFLSVLFIAPAMLHADDPPGCSIRIEVNKASEITWDIVIWPSTWGNTANLKYEIWVDGPMQVKYSGDVPTSNDWTGINFPVDDLSLWNGYEVKIMLFDKTLPEGENNVAGYNAFFSLVDEEFFPKKAEILKDSGIPGKGLENASGLWRPFNTNSQASENAGMKN